MIFPLCKRPDTQPTKIIKQINSFLFHCSFLVVAKEAEFGLLEAVKESANQILLHSRHQQTGKPTKAARERVPVVAFILRARRFRTILHSLNISEMARRKQTPVIDSSPTAPELPSKPLHTSTSQTWFHFPLLVVISLTLSSTFYSLASNFTAGDLSSVSRSLDEWWKVLGLLGWKSAELAVGWWCEYDSMSFKQSMEPLFPKD